MTCSYCGNSGHNRTTCPELCLVEKGQAMRGAAARDRETPNHNAAQYQHDDRRGANRVVHAKKGQSTAQTYRTGDVR
jgi:hypothetical protein